MPDDSKLETIPVGSLGIIAHKSIVPRREGRFLYRKMEKEPSEREQVKHRIPRLREGLLPYQGRLP